MTDEQNRKIVELYKQWAKTMVHYTYRKTNRLELSKDLVQEVFFIACYKADDVFSRGDHPEAWLFRALEKVILQECRKKYYHSELELTNASYFHTNQSSDDLLGIQNVLPSQLSEKEKEILIWRLEEHCTYEEIALRRHTSTQACRKQYSRAIAHCKELLKK